MSQSVSEIARSRAPPLWNRVGAKNCDYNEDRNEDENNYGYDNDKDNNDVDNDDNTNDEGKNLT